VPSSITIGRIATIFWRDLVMPGVGLYLLLIDPKLAHLLAWQAPIVLALLGTPIVGRGLPRAEEDGDG
jgi:hypothetical protein